MCPGAFIPFPVYPRFLTSLVRSSIPDAIPALPLRVACIPLNNHHSSMSSSFHFVVESVDCGRTSVTNFAFLLILALRLLCTFPIGVIHVCFWCHSGVGRSAFSDFSRTPNHDSRETHNRPYVAAEFLFVPFGSHQNSADGCPDRGSNVERMSDNTCEDVVRTIK